MHDLQTPHHAKMLPSEEPRIKVGLREGEKHLCIEVSACFWVNDLRCPPGIYHATLHGDSIELTSESGTTLRACQKLTLAAPRPTVFTVRNMPIGQTFHWERLQDQSFPGDLVIESSGSGLRLVNHLPLEQYLQSVVSSEMSPQSPIEFLKAHCIASRSWLLAQILRKKKQSEGSGQNHDLRWTDSATHQDFDVCNDDHCQRYHGIERISSAACEAIGATRGQVLVWDGEVCDARFSKCCGGVTEAFWAAWEDRDVPYLQPVVDCPPQSRDIILPFSGEAAFERFVKARPPAYCNVNDRNLLRRILPDFDFETMNFFRWNIQIEQDELRKILLDKTGIDFGDILDLVPRARGVSGRIYSMSVHGTKADMAFGKELEIRRILSRSHLYSSAFVIKPKRGRGVVPCAFILHGAGWGHGVGMCQIGAAAMAAQGQGCHNILHHYFKGAQVIQLYP